MRTLLLSLLLTSLIPLYSLAMGGSNNTEKNNSNNTEIIKNDIENVSIKANPNGDSKAISIILQDHKEIMKMILVLEKNLDKNVVKSRAEFKKLKTFLGKHEDMEQKIWYPELEQHTNLKEIIDQLKEEEKTASTELKELDNIHNDKEWVEKVKTLISNVKKHANNEETKLFPKIKEVFDKSQLDELGNKLEGYKNESNNS